MTTGRRFLSRGEAKAFYDRFGAKQDTQAFYEREALEALCAHSAFAEARAVLELGCGTGRFARELLRERLPRDASYLGLDISDTMVALARERVREFGPRARVERTDGSLPLSLAPGSRDRLVATYVLDLLAPEEIHAVLGEARRVLTPSGRLCLTALTVGNGAFSRGISRLWDTIHGWRPALVGGCRPVELRPFLSPEAWEILHDEVVVAFGVPSEVLVAVPRP